MPIPHPREKLPELMAFIDELDAMSKAGQLLDWDTCAAHILTFYSPEALAKIETVIPHWQQMTSYGRGITTVHVTLVVLATIQLPEYQAASPDEQTMMLWIAFFHDVEKVLISQLKDHVHGFRSAATAGRALPAIGFATKGSPAEIEAWAEHSFNAICSLEEALEHSPEPQAYTLLNQPLGVRETQDNRKLPEILAGIDALFEREAALIIKTVLLHMSIAVVDDYPYTAALCDAEFRAYVSPELLPLIMMMGLVDCDSWGYFDLPLKASWRSQILTYFARFA